MNYEKRIKNIYEYISGRKVYVVHFTGFSHEHTETYPNKVNGIPIGIGSTLYEIDTDKTFNWLGYMWCEKGKQPQPIYPMLKSLKAKFFSGDMLVDTQDIAIMETAPIIRTEKRKITKIVIEDFEVAPERAKVLYDGEQVSKVTIPANTIASIILEFTNPVGEVTTTEYQIHAQPAVDETYAQYDSDSDILYFHYDKNRDSYEKTYDVLENANKDNPQPFWEINPARVSFDETFTAFKPKSLYGFFGTNIVGNRELYDITGLENLNTSEVTTMESMFANCIKLENIDFSMLDTSKVETMAWMFDGCQGLTRFKLPSVNTGNLENMNGMFNNCRNLTDFDFGEFNTGNVTIASNMFNKCVNLKNVAMSGGVIDTSKNTTFESAFAECQVLEDLSGLAYIDTSNIKSFKRMFYRCNSLRRLGTANWDTSNATDFSNWLENCTKITSLELSHFDVSNVINFKGMFAYCNTLQTLDLYSWKFESCTNVDAMFSNCNMLREIRCEDDLSVRPDIVDSASMFLNCEALVGSKGTAYNPTYTNRLYARPDGGSSRPGYFTVEVEQPYVSYDEDSDTLTFRYDTQRRDYETTYDFDINNENRPWAEKSNCQYVEFTKDFAEVKPKSTVDWFNGWTSLTNIIDLPNLNTSEVTEMSGMFDYCSNLLGLDISHFDTSNVQAMSFMFEGLTISELDLGNFNMSKVIDAAYMFAGNPNLSNVILNGLDTSSLEFCEGMFSNCTSLEFVNLSSFDASKIKSIGHMFEGCTSLLSVSWQNKTFNAIETTNGMFSECSALQVIRIDNDFSVSTTLTDSENMFLNCRSVVGGQQTHYDPEHIDKSYAKLDNGIGNPGYFSSSRTEAPKKTTKTRN